VSPVKYERGFYIPEDDILHSDRRENLKSYMFPFCFLQMVTTNEGAPSSSDPGSESGTALSKLRQTLSSSLMTAQDKGTSQVTTPAV
jgi:hypothetical protein